MGISFHATLVAKKLTAVSMEKAYTRRSSVADGRGRMTVARFIGQDPPNIRSR